MNRLTNKLPNNHYYPTQTTDKKNVWIDNLLTKLGQLEDLMEKFGINDHIELEARLIQLKNLENFDFMIISTDECDQLIQNNDLLQLLIKKQANIQDLKQSKRLIDYNIDKKRNQKLTLDQFNALKQYMKKRR